MNKFRHWPLKVVVVIALMQLWWFLNLVEDPSDGAAKTAFVADDALNRDSARGSAFEDAAKNVAKEAGTSPRRQAPLDDWKARADLGSAKTTETELIAAKKEKKKASSSPEEQDENENATQKRTGQKKKAPRGTLSRTAIQSAISAALPKVRECFQAALRSDPSLAGKVVLSLEIVAEEGVGIVQSSRIQEEETYSPAFEACVLQKISEVTFDAPENGTVVVTYPFHFDPGGGFGGEEKNPAADEATAATNEATEDDDDKRRR